MLRLVCAASAAFLVLGLSAHAARPTSGSWTVWSFEYQTPVEQQTPLPFGHPCTWIVNPTDVAERTPGACDWGLLNNEQTWVGRCIWDADDYEQWTFDGSLAPGQSVSIQRCSYADGQEKLSYIEDQQENPSLEVTVTVGDQTVTSQDEACILGPDYDGGALPFPVVPGSNGGGAFLTPVTFTVTNTGTKTIRRQRVRAYLGIYFWTSLSTDWPGNRCRDIAGEPFGINPAWRIGAS